MNLVKKEMRSAKKHKAEQKALFICYICGRHHTGEAELCSACAEIISTRLKLLHR